MNPRPVAGNAEGGGGEEEEEEAVCVCNHILFGIDDNDDGIDNVDKDYNGDDDDDGDAAGGGGDNNYDDESDGDDVSLQDYSMQVSRTEYLAHIPLFLHVAPPVLTPASAQHSA